MPLLEKLDPFFEDMEEHATARAPPHCSAAMNCEVKPCQIVLSVET